MLSQRPLSVRRKVLPKLLALVRSKNKVTTGRSLIKSSFNPKSFLTRMKRAKVIDRPVTVLRKDSNYDSLLSSPNFDCQFIFVIHLILLGASAQLSPLAFAHCKVIINDI